MAQRSARRSSKKKKTTVMEVDFTGVESGGRSIGDGWAHGRVKKAEWTEAKETGNPMIAMQWAATRGKESATVFDNAVNTPNALWKMKMMLEALGIDVADGAMDVDVEDLIDLECDILIANEDYDGRDQPRIVELRPSGAGEIDEDDAEEKPRKKKKASRDDDDDQEDRGGRDDDDDQEEEKPRRKRRDEDDDDQEEERPSKKRRTDDDDDDSEEERPRKKRRDEDDDQDDNDAEIRPGSKVKFEDEKGKSTRGTVDSVDKKAETAIVATSKGDEYEISLDELELA